MAELCREHQLTSQMVGSWKQQFLAAMPQVFQKGDDSADQARIAELERMVGRLTMEPAGAPLLINHPFGCLDVGYTLFFIPKHAHLPRGLP